MRLSEEAPGEDPRTTLGGGGEVRMVSSAGLAEKYQGGGRRALQGSARKGVGEAWCSPQ